MAPQDQLDNLTTTSNNDINSTSPSSSLHNTTTTTTTTTMTVSLESSSNGLIHHIHRHNHHQHHHHTPTPHEDQDQLEHGLLKHPHTPPQLSTYAPSKTSHPSSSSTFNAPLSPSNANASIEKTTALKLLFGTLGIYASFLWYGSLQEDVFNYDNGSFHQAWFLQWLESMVNVVVGYFGMVMQEGGATKNLPQKYFLITGLSQASSKVFTSLSLASGLSFPVATLAKSGKMAPVMAGQLILGGASYGVRDYLSAAAVVGGTAILSMGKKKGGDSHSTSLGLRYILLSLIMDGITAGVQKRLKATTSKQNIIPKPYDMLFWTNVYMWLVALLTCLFITNEMSVGVSYCMSHPPLWNLIAKFCLCSAVGQSFIFYVVSHFDPLVCSTITTTRKMISVLLSIFTKGHAMTADGWCGVALASVGILSEVEGKISKSRRGVQRKIKWKTSM